MPDDSDSINGKKLSAEPTLHALSASIFSRLSYEISSKDHRVSAQAVSAVPVLVTLLEDETTPERQELLNVLCQIVRNCNRIINSGEISHIADHRLVKVVDAYRAISAGYPVYVSHLTHPSAEIRYAALKLIMQLMDHHRETRPVLAKLLNAEKNPVILATMLEGFSRMLAGKHKGEDPLHVHIKLITGFLSPEQDRLVQVAAAGAWLNATHADLYRGANDLPKPVLPLLLEALHHPIDRNAYGDLRLRDDDLKFINDYVLYARITWTGVDRSIQALNSPLLSTLQVHYLAREMLERVFERRTTVLPAPDERPYWRWQHFSGWLNYAHTPNAIRYRKVRQTESSDPYAPYPPDYREYRTGGRLNEWQQKVLRAIVECDVFWAIRSNLLSFFYGLPDDREALHAVVDIPAG